MSDGELPRAHYDDLEFDDDLALLNGKPFTGIVYDDHTNGCPSCELNYDKGLPSGIQREWYPGGQLEAEWNAIRGRGSEWSRKWHPNGVLKFERVDDENGIPVRIREWSEDGKLVRETGPGFTKA